MSRMGSEHGEIGRGRQDDSSSSRESSPAPNKQKRSFTPTSDDGDLVIPPVIDDDTPPPESAPIIRQAVAFSGERSAITTPVNTYLANVLSKPAAFFLPGQEVAVPPAHPKPPPPKRQSQPTKGRPTRKIRHFNDDFASQTSSFRVRNYDASMAITPPTYAGSGPYSSLYRAVAPSGAMASEATSATSSLGGGYPVHPSAGPSNQPRPSYTDNAVFYSDQNISRGQDRPSASPAQSQLSLSSPKLAPTTGRRGPSKRRTVAKAETSKKAFQARRKEKTARQVEVSSTTQGASSASHYRHDYDNQRILRSARVQSQSQDQSQSQPPARSDPEPTASISGNGDDALSIGRQSPMSRSQSRDVPAVPPPPARQMVTLLIEDVRSGVVDHQLAEVRVPLRVADNPKFGFWADAKEVVEQLQQGASRIDGPAKVYTMRERYRQFFLRVSTDNVDHYTSANLQVSTAKTLDIVIEPHLPLDGGVPPPPKIPKEVLGIARSPSPLDVAPYSSHVDPRDRPRSITTQGFYETLGNSLSVKRRRSLNSQSSDDSSTRERMSTTDPSVLSSRSRGASPTFRSSLSNMSSKKSRHYVREPYNFSGQASRFQGSHRSDRTYTSSPAVSPSPQILAETQEEVDEAIIGEIRPAILEDPMWMKFMESRAKPDRVSEILKQYRFVQGKLDSLVGKSTSPSCHGAPEQTIERAHVLQALNLSEQWGSDCTEMLVLLDLYGEGGKRFEDSRVVAMVNDTSAPQGKPAKRCLKLLREIDNQWHPEETEDEDTQVADLEHTPIKTRSQERS